MHRVMIACNARPSRQISDTRSGYRNLTRGLQPPSTFPRTQSARRMDRS
jgi:hypothetical protein